MLFVNAATKSQIWRLKQSFDAVGNLQKFTLQQPKPEYLKYIGAEAWELLEE